MRIGYFGPEGTFTHEAVSAATRALDVQLVPLRTIYDTVLAVHDGLVDRALVPIENSLEGSVNATLDTLAIETDDVAIVGELVHPIRQCLITRRPIALTDVEVVVSHPQPLGQCSRFLRTRLPQARVLTATSSAEAVRLVAERDGTWAALGTPYAAEVYECEVLLAGVEDVDGNETRFVWLAPANGPPDAGPPDGPLGGPLDAGPPDAGPPDAGPPDAGPLGGGPESGPGGAAGAAPEPFKTAIVFWGAGSESPGWLVACLTELASRAVNLTRIESRPRKQGLGSYMFFADLDGRDDDAHVADALAALRERVEVLRVLGSFPSAS
ncbi:MAG: prephenate dehydratase [Solirubrobacteraceae bacterium]